MTTSNPKPLTAERLREVLHYDPETGTFTWRVDIGKVVKKGRISAQGKSGRYPKIGFEGVVYWAHRLAWLYMTGEWPKVQIDHKDRCRTNNRWSNLREANYSQQQQNVEKRRDNTSGHPGVGWIPKLGKWKAEIVFGGRNLWCGSFHNKASAIAVRLAAEKRLFTHSARSLERKQS